MSEPTHEQTEECEVLAHQEIAVEADVTVRPTVHAGCATTKCVGCAEIRECGNWDGTDGGRKERPGRHHHRECHFEVCQHICVTIPIRFGAMVEAEVSDVECGTPKPGPGLR
jgi:hypothetical protein